MKILNLDLRAFGPFRDVVLDLSAGKEGLHIIYGPNEAGKSSSLRALRQMLYGIPHKSNDHFLVGDYNRLRVGGTLRNGDGHEFAFLRRKGNRDLLRTPDDTNTLDESSLQKYLAGVDQARFESLFSLDHEGLVKGGQAISSGGGLVGQLLFGGGSDLVRLNKLRKSLEEQHAELFNARATAKNPTLNKALRDLTEERKAIESASIRSDDWHDKRLQVDKVRSELNEINQTLESLRRQKSKRERISQALADVGRRAELIRIFETLKDAPQLRDGFGDERRSVENELRTAEHSRLALQEELAEIAKDLQETPSPGPLLGEAAQIENLQRRLGAYLKDEREVARLRVECAGLEESAQKTLRDLGRTESFEEVERLRLTLPQRQQLRELANNSRALVEACERTAKEIDRLKSRQTKTLEKLAALETPTDLGPLHQAVQRARREGGLTQRLEETKAEQVKLDRAADRAWKALQPKPPSREQLLEAAIPSETTILASQEALEKASHSVEDLRQKVKDAETTFADIQHKLERIALEREVPSEADLDAARTQRDQDWQEIRTRWLGEPVSQTTPPATPLADKELASSYEQDVVQADRVADRLRREADRVAEKAGLTADLRLIEPRLEALREELRQAESRHQSTGQRWVELWAPLGFEPTSPREMLAWKHEHTKLVEKVEACQAAEEQTQALTVKIDRIRGELGEVLRSLGETSIQDVESLDALIDHAESIVERSKALATQWKTLDNEKRETEARLAEAQTQDEEARHRWQVWREAWTLALAPLGMSGDAGTEVVGAVLDHLTSLFDGIDKAAEHRRRINAFKHETTQLETDVQALLPTVAPELLGANWIQAVEQLNERLTTARAAKTRRDDLEKRQERRRKESKQAENAIAETRSRLKALTQEAECSDPSELPEAEQRDQLRRSCEEELQAIDQRLRKAAAGAMLGEFIAEAQAADPDALEAELTRLEEEIRQKDDERLQAGRRDGELRNQLNAMEETSRDARAHEAANKAQGLLALIESKANEYVRLRLASAVLREAIERYRERNQGPVLRRAGEHFAELTQGSFAGLNTQLNDRDEPILVGLRPSGVTVGVEGMSEGTCDQLYLALKLASLEHHLDHNPALPFIADDLLVNFDDDRSLAALRTLAKLSKRTQVLFFTHHRHLIEIAEGQLPPDTLFVHELSGKVSTT